MMTRKEHMRRRYRHCGQSTDDTVCLPIHIWLVHDNGLAIRLIPNRKVHIMQQLHVNETATLSLQAVDVYGNIVDATLGTPVWSNSNEAAAVSSNPTPETLKLDPVTNAVGQETTVDVSVMINGTSFSAQEVFSVVAGPVAGISIVTNFNPKEPPPTP